MNKVVSHDRRPPLDAIRTVLESSSSVLVASHLDPDGDALGTQLAFAAYLRHLGKEVALVREGEIPSKYRFLEGSNDIPSADAYDPARRFDCAVILECPNIQRIGRASRLLNSGIRVINIDHHRDNDLFGEVNWIYIVASSVGELTFDLYVQSGYEIDTAVAEQLYTAIMTDTGRFRYRSTSPRTMEIVGKLIEVGADPQAICDRVYFNLEPSTMKLIGKVLNGIEFHHDGQICLLALTREMLQKAEAADSESDGLVDYTLFNAGVVAGALLKEVNSRSTKISLRSKDGINVTEIAARYGGGGHFNASGFTVDMPLEEARGHLITVLSEAIDRHES
ncbi:MAG: bifunctional oligoribonuclease/PAP phosphatase NrnA [Candidatus Zixiibacteriota bacterium]|nr:MAG: bifunctional oligoribonuclease/PAP phosphatase NrnA [candidate division Zixibacteria bacterium]